MCYFLYTYNYFSTYFQNIFVFLFLCNVRVSCSLSVYLIVKGKSTLFLNTTFLHCPYFSAILLVLASSSLLKYFQKLENKYFFQDLTKILKLVNHDVSLQISEIEFLVLIEMKRNHLIEITSLPIFYPYCKTGFIS